MLYNKDLKKVQTILDCLKCPYFDKAKKQCKGLNKICFEYDEKSKTCIDGVTKLPIRL